MQGKNPLILLEWEDFNFYKIEISQATEPEDKTSSEPVIKSEEEVDLKTKNEDLKSIEF